MRGRKIKSSLSRGNSRRRVMNMKRLRTMRKNRNSRNLLKNRRVTRKNNSKAGSRSSSSSRSRMSYRRKYNKRGGRSNRKRRNKRRSKQRGGTLGFSALPKVDVYNGPSHIHKMDGDDLKLIPYPTTTVTDHTGEPLEPGETYWDSPDAYGKFSDIQLGSKGSGSKVLELKGVDDTVEETDIVFDYLRTKPTANTTLGEEKDIGSRIEAIIDSTKGYGIRKDKSKSDWDGEGKGLERYKKWYKANIAKKGESASDTLGENTYRKLTALMQYRPGFSKDEKIQATANEIAKNREFKKIGGIEASVNADYAKYQNDFAKDATKYKKPITNFYSDTNKDGVGTFPASGLKTLTDKVNEYNIDWAGVPDPPNATKNKITDKYPIPEITRHVDDRP